MPFALYLSLFCVIIKKELNAEEFVKNTNLFLELLKAEAQG